MFHENKSVDVPYADVKFESVMNRILCPRQTNKKIHTFKP